jgi:hypothetical protein
LFGNFAGAQQHSRKTVELYDQTGPRDFANRFGYDPRGHAEVYNAFALWVLGEVDEALRFAHLALADAESAAHAPTMGQVLHLAAFLELVRRRPETVATHGRAFADIVSRYDLPAFLAGIAVFFQGWANWSDSADKLSLAEMRRGIAVYRQQGLVSFVPTLEAALAEAEAGAGETGAGLRRLDDALAEVARTEQRYCEAEMHRIRGEILLKRDPADPASAEQSLLAAIAIAHHYLHAFTDQPPWHAVTVMLDATAGYDPTDQQTAGSVGNIPKNSSFDRD